MFKKIVILLAVFTLLLGVCACGIDDGESGDPSQTTPSSTTTTTKATTASTEATTTASAEAATTTKAPTKPKQEATTTVTTKKPTSPQAEKPQSFPIVERETMMNGTPISFAVGNSKKGGNPIFSQVILVKSMNQLNSIIGKDPAFFSKYNNAFFNSNALLVVPAVLPSGSLKLQADSLVKSNGELCVGFTTFAPSNGIATGDMAYWCFALEVKKADASDITGVSYFGVMSKWGTPY